MNNPYVENAVDTIVKRIIARFSPEKIILFGSCATDSATRDSDIDLLIVMTIDGSRRVKANEIDLALADRDVPLDLLVVTPDQFDQEKHMLGSVVRDAVRHGKVVYERAA